MLGADPGYVVLANSPGTPAELEDQGQVHRGFPAGGVPEGDVCEPPGCLLADRVRVQRGHVGAAVVGHRLVIGVYRVPTDQDLRSEALEQGIRGEQISRGLHAVAVERGLPPGQHLFHRATCHCGSLRSVLPTLGVTWAAAQQHVHPLEVRWLPRRECEVRARCLGRGDGCKAGWRSPACCRFQDAAVRGRQPGRRRGPGHLRSPTVHASPVMAWPGSDVDEARAVENR